MESPQAEFPSDHLESSRGIGPDIQVADRVHPQGSFLERSKSAGLRFLEIFAHLGSVLPLPQSSFLLGLGASPRC